MRLSSTDSIKKRRVLRWFNLNGRPSWAPLSGGAAVITEGAHTEGPPYRLCKRLKGRLG
jgi:hypothetical protein